MTLPPCTAPLAWAPPGCDASCADELLAELKRFAAAAQLEVAGLPPAAAGAGEIEVNVTVHPDLGSFARSKTSLAVRADGSGRATIVGVHAFLEPEWGRFELPLAGAPGGAIALVHEEEREGPPPPPSAALADLLLLPTLCLKLKRREIIAGALLGGAAVCDDGSTVDRPDRQAAMRVNLLSWRWAAERATMGRRVATADDDPHPEVRLELADDRVLVDDPAGPLGNRGGLYIESRIRLREVTAADEGDGAPVILRVTSPTIITPLSGVPQPFLACHYMKVLCPLSEVLSRVGQAHYAKHRTETSLDSIFC